MGENVFRGLSWHFRWKMVDFVGVTQVITVTLRWETYLTTCLREDTCAGHFFDTHYVHWSLALMNLQVNGQILSRAKGL